MCLWGGVTNLGLSPKNYQFFDGFPITNLYLIELITKGDFNNKNRSVRLAVTFVKKKLGPLIGVGDTASFKENEYFF